MTMIARHVMRIGKAAVFAVGLAVTLALMLGVGTAALAAVPGDPFKLGKLNRIDGISILVGSDDGALFRVNNEGSGPALDLRVKPGEAPMNVNSSTRVNGLNSDQLDGKNSTAFVPTDTYVVEDFLLGEGEGIIRSTTANCDRGDPLLGGGFDSSADDGVIDSAPIVSDRSGWSVSFQDNGFSSVNVTIALCADLPPLKP